ncbi:enoyl-CoA hydratase-related protein [Sphingomonas lenta]|uniref:2-(1,2-epoxy-1,2-dihydrophenyl)acetyl-CoA isomerase n=1 Tax=Sphingomonas lenta TaxID=1141887 RepID=A0A2A2SG26_9SPHN|nr:enoyl-CoA hydratase-related protein [Sphingomonas lenta]PAX08178.1 2-(1,2-epoxy-1,2-dihydrophenyl)acetyl-CoA isomerase [Sphingomonas lenta]
MTEYRTILAERRGDVLHLTLNRPERLNALSLESAEEMSAALAKLDGARAVLITGAGRAFCSGADLQARGERSVSGGEASDEALTRWYNPLMARLAELPVPVVTAVNGPAAGIGCSLALAADFAVAGRSAYFLQAFVNIGLVPDGGASWMLPRLVGKARATEMMMLGEKIGAEKAEGWGLIHACVDDDALMEHATALADRLARGPTVALGVMRRNIARAMDGTYGDAMQREAAGQRTAAGTADAIEGARAFLEKRAPAFKGQ